MFKTMRWLLFVFLCGVLGFLCGVVLSQNNSKSIAKETALIFDELCKAHNQIMENADVFMRFSHYTDCHRGLVLYCPECAWRDILPDDMLPPDEGPSVSDLEFEDDVKEIHAALKTVNVSLFNQRVSLNYTLKRLREEEACHGDTPVNL